MTATFGCRFQIFNQFFTKIFTNFRFLTNLSPKFFKVEMIFKAKALPFYVCPSINFKSSIMKLRFSTEVADHKLFS